MAQLPHHNSRGEAWMVDVSQKSKTHRVAVAQAFVRLGAKARRALTKNPKGDPLGVARIAGIQASKRTAELIPLCHPLQLTHAAVTLTRERRGVRIEARIECDGATGVEMEALTAASVAALTLYDMLKSVERGIVIENLRLLEKRGGKSGDFKAPTSRAKARKRSPPAPRR